MSGHCQELGLTINLLTINTLNYRLVHCGRSLTTFNKAQNPLIKPQVLLIEMLGRFKPCCTSF